MGLMELGGSRQGEKPQKPSSISSEHWDGGEKEEPETSGSTSALLHGPSLSFGIYLLCSKVGSCAGQDTGRERNIWDIPQGTTGSY